LLPARGSIKLALDQATGLARELASCGVVWRGTGCAAKPEGGRLPYASVEDLPLPVRAHLPLHAREIYLGAFNNAWIEYDDLGPAARESTAHRVAWAAVKREYAKSGDQWVPREPD
jgi:Putative cation transport regulator